MTIEYKDSKRIVKLSTDKLPSSTYETDFSSTTGWSVESGGITYVDSIHYNHPSGVAMNTGVLYDLTTSNVSETSWTLDYDLNITTSTGGSGSSCQLFIGLSNNSTVSSSAIDTAQDYLGHFMIEAAGTHAIRKGNGSDSPEDPVGTVFSRALEADVLYCRLQRISAIKGTLSFYSDQGRTSLIESKDITITTALAGLRYLKVILACKTTSGSHVMVGDITNMKFWNTITSGIEQRPTNVQDNSLLVEKNTARRYWFTPQTVDTEQAFSFTTTDTVNALWGNRIYGMKLLSGHSGLNKYIKKIKTYHPTNPTGSRLTTGTLYHVILDSSGTEIARSAGVSASSVSNNSWAETTLSSPVKLLENYTVGVTISTGSGSSYLGTAVNNNGSSPTNTTRYYKDESGNVGLSTSETMLMVFDSDPATGLSIPATWTMQPTFQDDFSTNKGWTNLTSNTSVTTKLN